MEGRRCLCWVTKTKEKVLQKFAVGSDREMTEIWEI